MASIGENIKYYRKLKKLTQKQLGALIGCATITIQQYEAGKFVPKIDRLQRIADALGISVVELDKTLYINNFCKSVGDNISTIRSRKGLTQSDLGELLGVSLHNIEQLENGEIPLSIKKIEDIAKKMDVHLQALLSGTDIDYNLLSEDRSKGGRELTKRLSVVKLLDCIYDCATITKVKIYNQKDKEEIYNEEYVTISSNGTNCVFDSVVIDSLVNMFENICKNMFELNGEFEESYIAKYFPSPKDDGCFFRFYDESLIISGKIKSRHENLSISELEKIKKQIQQEIENKSNVEEFYPANCSRTQNSTTW